MKKTLLLSLLLLCGASLYANGIRSIREFGVLPGNSPEENKRNMQKAIDWASPLGAALWIEPTDTPYPMDGGIILKRNVSLIGAQGPTGRGTADATRSHPVGSVFAITDTNNPFIITESATTLRGIQFYYPEQTHQKAADIIPYHPTIQAKKGENVQGVTLSCLTFYGEYIAMDYLCTPKAICEQILIEHCYGYPLSGQFVRIDYCYDIPRILHCHINPSNMREFRRTFNKEVIDAVIANPTFAFYIDHTDNAQLMDVFTFGTYGGIYLGNETYGQLTNFNLDCVTIGIHKLGSQTKNRNWMIAQGSIIANAGKSVEEIHPIIIEGQGHTAISNVEAFSGENGALTAIGQSYDFLLVKGDKPLTISLFGCRMRNYVSSSPITLLNPHARIQAVACVDKEEQFYNR